MVGGGFGGVRGWDEHWIQVSVCICMDFRCRKRLYRDPNKQNSISIGPKDLDSIAHIH